MQLIMNLMDITLPFVQYLVHLHSVGIKGQHSFLAFKDAFCPLQNTFYQRLHWILTVNKIWNEFKGYLPHLWETTVFQNNARIMLPRHLVDFSKPSSNI